MKLFDWLRGKKKDQEKRKDSPSTTTDDGYPYWQYQSIAPDSGDSNSGTGSFHWPSHDVSHSPVDIAPVDSGHSCGASSSCGSGGGD